jgi:hypothetical protein
MPKYEINCHAKTKILQKVVKKPKKIRTKEYGLNSPWQSAASMYSRKTNIFETGFAPIIQVNISHKSFITQSTPLLHIILRLFS